MAIGKVGGRVILESEQVGRPTRQGEILEILGAPNEVHYRVRWDDGHESIFFPSAGSVTIVPAAKKRTGSRTA